MAERLHFYRFPDIPVMVCVLDTHGFYSVGSSASKPQDFDEKTARTNAELNARRAKSRHVEPKRQARAAETDAWRGKDWA